MKSKNQFELDPERLATTDEHGNRVYLYPEDVKGVWKHRRKIFYWFLIALYLILPWIYIKDRPALMVNIFKREFSFMGFTLFGVEPILFFLLVASGLFLMAFLTSVLGRVWCGWACPQTVFIQAIFWKIEAFFEGSARQRRERDKQSLSIDKFIRRLLKWAVFLIVSLHIAHTFIGYFIGPRELLHITMNSPSENWGIFVATMILTLIFLLDFGWFREQFCIIACPYGRIQSVLMDENSLVVSYDTNRGEYRRGSIQAIETGQEGDCINCYNCVKVCPTGIDIRRGTQLECIACTQCIDACDDIMTKVKKPKGLIRYSSENQMQGKQHKNLTPRSAIYIFICLLLMSSFGYFLNSSSKLHMVFLRTRNAFQMAPDGQNVINQFNLKLNHQGSRKYRVLLMVQDSDLKDTVSIVSSMNPIVADQAEKKAFVFVKFNPSVLTNGTRKVQIGALDIDSSEIISTKEITLVGPVL